MGSLFHSDNEIAPPMTTASHPPLPDTEVVEDAMDCGFDYYDDTQIVEGGFGYDEDDTQVMCLAGETQAMDLGGETQLLDGFDCGFGDFDETQLLDLDDLVVGDSDVEEEDATQVLDVGEGVEEKNEDEVPVPEEERARGVGDDGEKREGCRLVDQKLNEGLHVSTATPVVEESPELNSGYVRMHFTAVRAASLRTSGFRRKSESRSRQCTNHSLEQLPTPGGVDNGNDRICSSTVRKLFSDDLDSENEGFPCESNGFQKEDLFQMPSCDLAGLSYVDSQEPGELSQANALNFVDKFLQENVEDSDKESHFRQSLKEISKVVSSAKGSHILAKKANDISLAADAGIYEWDENCEDEGGGELFCRKKTDFFGSGRHGSKSLPLPRKTKRCIADKPSDTKHKLRGKSKKNGAVHSDSKVLVQNSKAGERTESEYEIGHTRNLTKEFNEFNICSTRGQLGVHDHETHVPEILNVGIDTQIAAEAMEALLNSEDISNCEANNTIHKNTPEGSMGEKMKSKSVKKVPSRKRAHSSDAAVDYRKPQTRKTRRVDPNLNDNASIAPLEIFDNCRKLHESAVVMIKSKKAQSRAANQVSTSQVKMSGQNLQQGGTFAPIARRTRQSMLVKQLNQAENSSSDCGIESNSLMEDGDGVRLSENSNSSKPGQDQASRVANSNQHQIKHADVDFEAVGNGAKLDGLNFPRGRRSRRIMFSKGCDPENLDDPFEPSIQPKKIGKSGTRRTRSENARGTVVDKTIERRSSAYGSLVNKNPQEKLAQKNLDKGCCDDAPSHNDGEIISEKIIVEKTARVPSRCDASPSVKMRDTGGCQQSHVACTTPVNQNKVAVKDASPVCMGDEYFKQSCKRSLSTPSLLKELRGLSPHEFEPTSPSKNLRRKRDITEVRVLYSHRLDDDIIKQQKKVLSRLGISVASSMADATHFIADQFVRTRNMLEAIASGKPVVTHLWVDSCGQANCFIDEKNYILRDSKKEREFGFSMPASLAHACQYPLLKDRKVFITPNTKPGKETISTLVKSVNGQAVERIGRSALTADQIPENLLVISCAEDYEICVPLLEKGAAVYSSELVLNGIVTQRLEFERYHLFTDEIKKTRSTIWLRKDGNKFQPVSKKRRMRITSIC